MSAKCTICAFGLLLLSNLVVGQQVFKSIDETGKVTYSSSPQQDAVKAKPVDIAPGPPAEQIEAAQQRAEAMKQQAQAIERLRKPQASQRAGANGSPGKVTITEASGTSTTNDPRPDPLTRVPVESPSDGDHSIYDPEKNGKPSRIQPVPSPRRGGR